tara:strand:- start:13 stop:327 length:315 start_codon:yes stop_codon:yes gene_type:complete
MKDYNDYIIKEKDYELLDFEFWYNKYKPIEKNAGNIFFEVRLEKDIKFLKEFQAKNSFLNIWTLVEGDFGELFIDSGWRYVNRIQYIATEIPRESKDILVQAEY